MNSDLRDKISTAATAVEIVLGLIILLACVIGSIGLVCTTEMDQMLHVPEYFQERLSDACLIIIGIELIKMITSYTIDSVVDVMLLAIARQMVVEHTTPLENLLAVLSVGVLFVIRKYLYIRIWIAAREAKRTLKRMSVRKCMDSRYAEKKRERRKAVLRGRPSPYLPACDIKAHAGFLCFCMAGQPMQRKYFLRDGKT